MGEVLGGDVDAILFVILAHVAQNVCELEGDAALFGQFQRFRIVEAKDVNDREADHARNVIAVIVKLAEGLDAARLQIAGDAGDHVEEIFVRDFVALDGVDKGGPQSGERRGGR